MFTTIRFGLLAAVLAAMGCSAVVPPKEALVAANVAIDEASDADAAEHGALELRMAREQLEQAEVAAREERYVAARRLAEKARADAQLAKAKALAAGYLQGAEEAKETLRTLERETQRRRSGAGIGDGEDQ